jgi:hypothetical protein
VRTFLKFLFGAILICMTIVTVHASIAVSLWTAWDSYAANPWAVATLWDAYCGFTIFYCWVCYKERSRASRVLWFVLIMGLGNIATSLYLLIQLFLLPDSEPLESLVRRRA